MVRKAIQGALLFGFAVALVRCGDDAKKATTSDEGGAAHGGEAPSSGGSGDVGETAGAPPSNGGMPGSAGEPSSDGGMPSAGGAPSTSGAPGAAGELNLAGAGACEPADCCTSDQPTCEAGWDTDCSGTGAYQTCCDPSSGIYRSCGYAGGGIERDVSVCVNDCTGKSYGVSACTCLVEQDPGCDTDWSAECSSGQVFCSDFTAGYRLSCVEDGNNRTVEVECVCDPDAIISGRRR
jgi:hypothetical protein